MAYSTSNPPQVKVEGLGSGGQTWWAYVDEDIHTDIDAADYFSNGHALGMKVNDLLIHTKSTATIGATLHVVTAVTVGGAATVSPAILA